MFLRKKILVRGKDKPTNCGPTTVVPSVFCFHSLPYLRRQQVSLKKVCWTLLYWCFGWVKPTGNSRLKILLVLLKQCQVVETGQLDACWIILVLGFANANWGGFVLSFAET